MDQEHETAGSERYQHQHMERLSWMPHLYFTLKEHHRAWAKPWQEEIQARLTELETVRLGDNCFIAPSAHIFAEPRHPIVMGQGCSVGAEAFLHGTITLGCNVGINPRVHMDGRQGGIHIGDDCRIAANVMFFAFDHQVDPARLVREQPVWSRGIHVGRDVWIGAGAGITDGVTVGDHAVVGMGAVVTRNVPEWAVVAGVPARVIGDRRHRRTS